MPKAKIPVSIDVELYAWLDENVKSGRFSTVSHGINYCVKQFKDLDLVIQEAKIFYERNKQGLEELGIHNFDEFLMGALKEGYRARQKGMSK